MTAATRLGIWLHRKWTGHHTRTYPGCIQAIPVECECGRLWLL